MELTRLTLVEVGDIAMAYRRPFEWHSDGEHINEILEVVDRTGDSFGQGSLTDVSHRILTVSSSVEDVILAGIDDWRDKRYRFWLEVIIEPYSRTQKMQLRAIITGYTDRAEISLSNKVDPETKMYVNSVVTVRDFVDPNGITKTRLMDTTQALLGTVGRREDTDYLIRPSDIFANIEGRSDAQYAKQPGDVDTRSTFHSGGQLADRRDSLPGNYVYSLIRADLDAQANLETSSVNYDTNRDVMAHDMLSTKSYAKDRFLREVCSQNRNFSRSNSFTYESLAKLMDLGMAELDAITTVYGTSNLSMESEDWHGADAETIAAYRLCHAIPIIMIDSFVDTIRFTADNYDSSRTDDPAFVIADMTSILGRHFYDKRILRTLESRFLREVFQPMSNNGMMDIWLDVDVDVNGFTIVLIEINGGDRIRYVFQSFADAMFTPIITHDLDRGEEMADEYLEIRKFVDEAVDRKRSTLDLTSSVSDARASRDSARGRSSRQRDDGLSSILQRQDTPDSRRRILDISEL